MTKPVTLGKDAASTICVLEVQKTENNPADVPILAAHNHALNRPAESRCAIRKQQGVAGSTPEAAVEAYVEDDNDVTWNDDESEDRWEEIRYVEPPEEHIAN